MLLDQLLVCLGVFLSQFSSEGLDRVGVVSLLDFDFVFYFSEFNVQLVEFFVLLFILVLEILQLLLLDCGHRWV